MIQSLIYTGNNVWLSDDDDNDDDDNVTRDESYFHHWFWRINVTNMIAKYRIQECFPMPDA